ncbi:glycolipid transfer protein [Dendrothele bispora CBS 962.96]|uniref:Glycolipid transfer protein n=1 Tax=Dendrothele bispora (strain CBS 962.96) TaxID=1314807 RepID=A0A4S8M4N7_DENBC|nr:glycolipid transfer protein [Dendrothele bispora CBS 962.96]
MAPYLQTVKSFADVPITKAGVDTLAFLEASNGLVGLFNLLGSAAFTPVQNDLKGNIMKVRARSYGIAPDKSATLEELVKNEQGEKNRTVTEGLVWLLRGQSFTSNQNEELSVAFTKGYDSTLRKYHNFVVKGIYGIAMNACPCRKDFSEKLAADPAGGPAVPQAKVNGDLTKRLNSLDGIVKRMEVFYEKGGYGKV